MTTFQNQFVLPLGLSIIIYSHLGCCQVPKPWSTASFSASLFPTKGQRKRKELTNSLNIQIHCQKHLTPPVRRFCNCVIAEQLKRTIKNLAKVELLRGTKFLLVIKLDACRGRLCYRNVGEYLLCCFSELSFDYYNEAM